MRQHRIRFVPPFWTLRLMELCNPLFSISSACPLTRYSIKIARSSIQTDPTKTHSFHNQFTVRPRAGVHIRIITATACPLLGRTKIFYEKQSLKIEFHSLLHSSRCKEKGSFSAFLDHFHCPSSPRIGSSLLRPATPSFLGTRDWTRLVWGL